MYVDKTPTWIFSRWKSHSSLSLFSHVRWSNSIIIFKVFCWTNSSMSICLLYRGSQNRTQCSRCWLEGKDYLLWYAGNAFPDIAQGDFGFPCCKNILSVKIPKSFPVKDFAFPFAEFNEIPACWGPYEVVAQPPHLTTNPPGFLPSANLLRLCSVPPSRLSVSSLNNAGPSTNADARPFSRQTLCCLEDWYLSQVSGRLIVPLFSLCFIIFSTRLLQQTGLDQDPLLFLPSKPVMESKKAIRIMMYDFPFINPCYINQITLSLLC